MIYFGLSEETGMKDIEYFCKTQQIPDVPVTDTNFPICYGEKVLRAELNFQTDGNLIDFHAGSVVNVIPSKAEVLLSGVSLEEVKRQFGDQEALRQRQMVRMCGSPQPEFPDMRHSRREL